VDVRVGAVATHERKKAGSVRIEINFTKSGMGIEEGTVVRWLKAVGDAVEKDEVILEIETVKALQEILAPNSGTLAEILVPEGETAPVNSPLGSIQTPTGSTPT
jgi:2-oxoglutarate dehydrogenase E2 component (dihydrolipoamide succinyltransferase)